MFTAIKAGGFIPLPLSKQHKDKTMGDLAEFYREEKERYKERCINRNEKYEPQLIAIGAVCKSDGVYELDGYFLYPTKGFAMSKKNPRKRVNLDKFIKRHSG